MRRLAIFVAVAVGLGACSSSPPVQPQSGTGVQFYCDGPHGIYMIEDGSSAYNKMNYTIVPRDPACPQVDSANPATTVNLR